MKNAIPFFALTSLALSTNIFAGTLAEDLRTMGVNPIVIKKSSERIKNNEHPEDRYFLQVKLGKLSLEQFKGLMKRIINL